MNIPVFAHDHNVKTGKAAAKVHPSLDPKGVKVRESRDSDAHPVSVPIAVILDVTGSMAQVPPIIEAALPKLMGHFLNDKASGKHYLGDGYPAILIGAVDDYDAMAGHGCLQMGQFESGMEIDQNLENIWLTGNGGGTYHESYELALYFMARHTAHDHMDKRGQKGYIFIIGDEHAYPHVKRAEVEAIIGPGLQADMTFEQVLAEARELYHVFFVIPAMTHYYNDPKLYKWWMDQLGQQNILKLAEPKSICELIVSTVAICEQHATLEDLGTDGVANASIAHALVPLSKSSGADAVDKYSASGLPAMPGAAAGGAERL